MIIELRRQNKKTSYMLHLKVFQLPKDSCIVRHMHTNASEKHVLLTSNVVGLYKELIDTTNCFSVSS